MAGNYENIRDSAGSGESTAGGPMRERFIDTAFSFPFHRMAQAMRLTATIALIPFFLFASSLTLLAEEANPPKAFLDGTGDGFRTLGKDDFVNVNCAEDTWSFTEDGEIHCTGKPTGVMRSTKMYKNFELVVQWRHLKPAGNSGVFVWTPQASLERLQGPGLPHGIEVQVLDTAYGQPKPADWYTSHGDVFPVGSSTMKPFPPLSPNGSRSFPSKNLSKDSPQWNHYYIRAINGEVRLWVNGEEVSGGNDCRPSEGYLCLESEGSPIEFRGLRIRELP